jgi:hypothetical protein
MARLLHIGALLAGLTLIVVLGLLPESEVPGLRRRERPVEGRAVVSETVGGVSAPPASPTTTPEAMVAAARGDLLTHRPAGLLTGPFNVEGPAEMPDALAELALSASQRAILDALMADRDARLQEIRRAVEARPPTDGDADRFCADAERAQAVCLSSIRGILLPEQLLPFDRLVKSGRWGGYTLVIPR